MTTTDRARNDAQTTVIINVPIDTWEQYESLRTALRAEGLGLTYDQPTLYAIASPMRLTGAQHAVDDWLAAHSYERRGYDEQWGAEWCEQRWTIEDVAEDWGVQPATVRSYLAREQMPAPDGRLGRTPWWWAETIRAARV